MTTQKICPYPGLRPFTEDESIYFKGREEHIERIIAQLEERKFLMLTGSSGDGKSSIVYAGVIPNARAGFFKAKFNSWLIADFRPERTPLKNMAIALSEKLGYNDENFVEKELEFGFSSLIKLYKNSPFYLDYKSTIYEGADEKEKKALKRKAANLFILVDQFEEFFTNAENYHQGKVSLHSQTVINLLLETARIALAEDLPIYIICTMRSDYIGQCAAFRGLPEYIGFSQFFVPRLKRKEIHQVIEEPALLSGNKISNRLTETLINEIGEGFDQLPVLQHALNQIWTQADKGNEEMDLVHLAKLSGLPGNYLPEKDKQVFAHWLNSIPEFKRAFFTNPSLENVLNAHANELYETTCDYYNTNHEDKITNETAHLIIKIVFQCLTKIDDSRAVRNRMTLEQLTNVINHSEITTDIVGGLLDYFRLQGNTFLKPFILSEDSSASLKNHDVLDITHESLIRNWDLLREWAKEEHENYLNFLDFSKQLERWIANGKDKGYLLPIGPLTFFENWYNKSKPNKYWLARYDESDSGNEEKLQKAENALRNANEFLKKSARNLFFSRFVLKHGANKLAAYIGIILLVVSCGFYYYDYTLKLNDKVIDELEERGLELLASNKVAIKIKAEFVIRYEHLNPNTFDLILDRLDNDTMAFDIADKIFELVQNFEDKSKTKVIDKLVYPVLNYLDGRLDNLINSQRVNYNKTKAYHLDRLNKYLSNCAYVKSYTDDNKVNALISKNTWILDKLLHSLMERPADSSGIIAVKFNNSIHLLLALKPATDFKYYIDRLSIFEGNKEAQKRFSSLYPLKEKSILSHNAGYQILAELYAANAGSPTRKITQCLDSIIRYNFSYGSNHDHLSFYSILNTLSFYNKYTDEAVDSLLEKFTSPPNAGYFNLLKIMDRIADDNFKNHIDFRRLTDYHSGYNYYSKYFCSKNQREKVWAHQLKWLINRPRRANQFIIRTVSEKGEINESLNSVRFDESDFNFQMALYYKRKGSYYEEIQNDLGSSHQSFKKAFEYFDKLATDNQRFYDVGALYYKWWEPEKIKMSYVFLYPMVMCEPLTIYHSEHGSVWTLNRYGSMPEESQSTEFFKFILKNGLTKLYENKEGVEILETFYYNNYDPDTTKLDKTLPVMLTLQDILVKKPDLQGDIYDEFLLISNINRAFDSGDTSVALTLFSKLDLSKIKKSGFLDSYQKKSYREGFHSQLLRALAINLALHSRLSESFLVLSLVDKESARRNTMTDIAYKLQEKGPIENTFNYLDTIFKNNEPEGQPKFGLKLIQTMAMVGSKEMFQLCLQLMKDVPETKKAHATISFIRGVAYNGYYYEAREHIPENASSNQELQLITEILKVEERKRMLKEHKLTGHKIPAKPAYEFYGTDFEDGVDK